jgi:hypothetical protein
MSRMICLCITGFLIFSQAGISSAQGTMDDSIMVKELLVMDTVDLEIYGPSNDVAFYMNGLVFLSNTKYHHSVPPEHITFGQVTSYFVPLEYVALESSRPLFSNDPFPYDPAGTCYSRDYQKVYFTKKMEISGRRRPEKIFEMDIINGKATNHNQLSFTAGSTRYMHPAVSTNGEFMILASDLAPSNGGLDLFIVRKNESGWMMPVNLGGDINTSGHEWYPFLDQHNNLFFSSSGHLGFGGYDVYICLFNENGWGKPQNLTDLVNTSKDELGFSIHPNRKMAVFSTNSEEEVLQEEVLKLGLNKNAFVLAGIDTENQDLSLLLIDMIRTGYTSAKFGAASALEVEAGFSLTSLPLLSESGPEPVVEEPAPEPAKVVPVVVPVVVEPEPEPEPILVVAEPEPEPVVEEPAPEPVVEEPAPEPDPNQVIFRVQILSASKANSRPSVAIAGSTYNTWEYYYKGAYRITVGEYTALQDALALRTKCKNSGFSQCFVAAFRGNERETDPAVFQR